MTQIPDFSDKQDQMTETLLQWSAINSGSLHVAGLNQMKQHLISAFSPLNAETNDIILPEYRQISDQGLETTSALGSLLTLTKRPKAPLQILLCGHMDTVYGQHHPFQTPRFIDDNCLNGPGVADMKGGLLVMLEALTYLESLPEKEEIGWRVCINPDEELGSPGSASYLAQFAPQYDYALVFEPALTPEGLFAAARKGSGLFTLIVHGHSAHIGRNPEQGKHAIMGLMQLVQSIHQLNTLRPGLFINVGYCHGGGPLNMIPDLALAKIAIRTGSVEDEKWCPEKIADILRVFQEKYQMKTTWTGHFHRPPKPFDLKHQALFAHLKTCGAAMGLPLSWTDTGGCCDGNNLAKEGLVTIDTMGVRGGQIHSDQEYILLDSLPERVALTVRLLLTLCEQDHAQG